MLYMKPPWQGGTSAEGCLVPSGRISGTIPSPLIEGTVPRYIPVLTSLAIYGASRVSGTLWNAVGSSTKAVILRNLTVSGSLPSVPSSMSYVYVTDTTISGALPPQLYHSDTIAA